MGKRRTMSYGIVRAFNCFFLGGGAERVPRNALLYLARVAHPPLNQNLSASFASVVIQHKFTAPLASSHVHAPKKIHPPLMPQFTKQHGVVV